jgi:hypothetical protein
VVVKLDLEALEVLVQTQGTTVETVIQTGAQVAQVVLL